MLIYFDRKNKMLNNIIENVATHVIYLLDNE
jgi:hypothetical protein